MRRRPSGIPPPTLKLCKRKRYAEKQIVFIRQLMCAPSISERIARKLLAHFGGLPALQRALADLDAFPKIRRDKSCLGRAQQKHLAAYLMQPAPSSGESIVGALVRATGARRERAGAARRGMRRRVSRARAAGRPKKSRRCSQRGAWTAPDAPLTASPRPVWLKQCAALTAPMLRCGKYTGHSFEHVAAEDANYCEWILRASDDGKRLPRDLNSFSKYLREHHGGVLCVGKFKHTFFDEVVREGPGYCDWVRSLEDPGLGLKRFAEYFKEQERTAETTETAGSAKTTTRITETPSPPPKRRRREPPAAQTCSVCYTKPVECALIPCGHASCCLRCARLVDDADGRCPI